MKSVPIFSRLSDFTNDDMNDTGSRGCLVSDWQPTLGQAGVGARTEEVWAYTSATINTWWSLLHDSTWQRLAADSSPANERQGKGIISNKSFSEPIRDEERLFLANGFSIITEIICFYQSFRDEEKVFISVIIRSCLLHQAPANKKHHTRKCISVLISQLVNWGSRGRYEELEVK